jgi:predicted cupin superfamily sugar epimerase
MTESAAAVIDRLGLTPHPEGGWFRETWRDEPKNGGRGAGTSILFLLEGGRASHWHRIDATELWFFQAGASLELRTSSGKHLTTRRLGCDLLGDDLPQARVEPGQWQAARSLGPWSLVACVVVPAFDFARFEVAPEGWAPRRHRVE